VNTRSWSWIFVVILLSTFFSVVPVSAAIPEGEARTEILTARFTPGNIFVNKGSITGKLVLEHRRYANASLPVVCEGVVDTRTRDSYQIAISSGSDVWNGEKSIDQGTLIRGTGVETTHPINWTIEINFSFETSVIGSFEVLVNEGSQAVAEAHQPTGLWFWYGSALAETWFEFVTEWWVAPVLSRRTSLPVAEHVIFIDMPRESWWADLWRVEVDGNLTKVPSLQPANQLPSPVHADLMVHGSEGCRYLIRVNDKTGTPLGFKTFMVKNTGSKVGQEFHYPWLDDVSW